ncbi:MAG: nuclear transport factor 2 family protein [Steroidobacteraceae bacterium]
MDLSGRIRRIEDRDAIRRLVADYCKVVDDRDLAALTALFAPDAVMKSRDGVMNARGRGAIAEMFKGRFAVLGPTFHYTHDVAIDLSDDAPDEASALVSSHAEVFRTGVAMIAAIRYHDRLVRLDERWHFAERDLAFFYYVPCREYEQAMGSRLRMRAYGDQRPADWPETLATWKTYHGD